MADPIFLAIFFTVWLRPCTDAGEPGGHAGTSGAGRAGGDLCPCSDKDGSYTSKEDVALISIYIGGCRAILLPRKRGKMPMGEQEGNLGMWRPERV